MEDVLRSRGLFRITSGKETEPTDDDKKIKWENRCDESRGLIGMSISTDLRFHISGIDEPDKTWEKFESVFGKHRFQLFPSFIGFIYSKYVNLY